MEPKSRILVVDDEAIIAASLQAKLKTMGYDVPETAGSAAEAIQKADALRPHLVLMDVRLEGGPDGIEAAHRIRQDFGIPAVFLSAYSDDETLKRATITEPFGYILKPVVDRELRIVIEIALYRSNAERALQLSEEKYRALVESASDAILSTKEDGTIEFANTAAVNLFGYFCDALIGADIEMLISNKSALNVLYLAGGTNGRAIEFNGTRKDGSTFPLELTLSKWNGPGRISFTATLRDISERKQSETIMRKNAEMLEANRLKDEFIAVVSHELRTPLTAIYGWVKIMRQRELGPQERARCLDVLERNVMSQKKLVDDLLDVSRAMSGKIVLNAQPLQILSVVQSAVQTVQPSAAEKNIAINWIVEPGELFVYGDYERLQQIFCNLLSNAIKFSPNGGEVRVSIKKVGSQVAISVADSGIGIDPDSLPYLFERFRQADASITRVYRGLGLGLAIVRGLVELHKGTVVAESEGTNRGATFTVKLPISVIRTSGSEAPGVAVEDVGKQLQNVRILLIEDEQDSRDLLVTVLEQYGAVVSPAGNATEAFSKFDTFKPDVLVCDIGLPEEDGYAVIQKIRAKPRHSGGEIPALALTAYSRPEDKIRAIASGFHAHLGKPTDPDEFVKVVVGLLGVPQSK
ncbi:MAG TPA: response regulator [Planctomycetota bacterium]|nr:response regulator [Planctomycetota bacterium]